MTDIIPILQFISGGSWLIVVAFLLPASWSLLFCGEESGRNARAVMMSFIGLTQVGFSIRWLLFGNAIHVMGAVEMLLWAGLYVMSTVAALAIIRLHWIGGLDA